jgi:UDP-N-acetylmuramoyl-tripeptide--D-alanyl-D-alanine ligase
LHDLGTPGHRVAVLADMLELGQTSPELHYQAGMLAAARVDRIFCYGSLAREIARGAMDAGLPEDRVVVTGSHAELVDRLLEALQGGDRVLIKGSRGMRMEKITEALRVAKRKTTKNGN